MSLQPLVVVLNYASVDMIGSYNRAVVLSISADRQTSNRKFPYQDRILDKNYTTMLIYYINWTYD